MFCEKTFDSKIPNMNLTEENYELVALVNRELHEYISVIEKGKLREGKYYFTITKKKIKWYLSKMVC